MPSSSCNTGAADANDARCSLGRTSNSFNTEAADAHDARCRVCSAAALGAADAYDVRCNVFPRSETRQPWAADAHDGRQGWPYPQTAATPGRLILMMLGARLALPGNATTPRRRCS